MRKQLKRGGYISVNLFGDRHSYAAIPFITCLSRARVEELLKGLNVITLKEIERKATAADGREVISHEFIILAQRK